MFGHRSNVSLVFEFVDTDLEQIIKDNNVVLTPANIKAYTLMTLEGLEYLHLQWILHRVCNLIFYTIWFYYYYFNIIYKYILGFETQQFVGN